MDYMEIEKDQVPYRFDMSIADEAFTFEIQYNSEFDFFTVDLEKDGEVLVVGEQIVYGMQLFYDVIDERFPKVPIIPYDSAENVSVVNYETLGVDVFLYLYETEDDEDEE